MSFRPSDSTAGGFTLLEVVFCLAIIGGAFLMLLLDRLEITDSMQESIRMRHIQRLAHEKLQAFIHGVEEASQGTFEETPKMDWKVEVNNVSSADAGSTAVIFVDCRITVTYRDELDEEKQYELSTWVLPAEDDPILDELPAGSFAAPATGTGG